MKVRPFRIDPKLSWYQTATSEVMTVGITIDRVHIEWVLTALQQQAKHCRIEEVVGLCSDLTRDQVFLAIDYLSRNGKVCMASDLHGIYWVWVERS